MAFPTISKAHRVTMVPTKAMLENMKIIQHCRCQQTKQKTKRIRHFHTSVCCKVFLLNSFLRIVTRNDIVEFQQERMSITRNHSELFNQVSIIQSNNASFLQIQVACLCPNASLLMPLRVYCLIVQEILLICFRSWVFGFKTSHDH